MSKLSSLRRPAIWKLKFLFAAVLLSGLSACSARTYSSEELLALPGDKNYPFAMQSPNYSNGNGSYWNGNVEDIHAASAAGLTAAFLATGNYGAADSSYRSFVDHFWSARFRN